MTIEVTVRTPNLAMGSAEGKLGAVVVKLGRPPPIQAMAGIALLGKAGVAMLGILSVVVIILMARVALSRSAPKLASVTSGTSNAIMSPL